MFNDLTESIRSSSRKIVRELGFLNKYPRDEDICASQIHIMVELKTFGSLSAVELIDKLQLDKSTISRSTKILMENGWIDFKTNKMDARSKEYFLTKSGFERLKLSDIRARSVVLKALAQLSKEEQEIVIKGLSLYGNALTNSRMKNFEIKTLNSNRSTKDLVKFINSIQVQEFSIPVSDKMNENLYHASSFYKDIKGKVNFWVAESHGEIVGTVGLLQISKNQGELKKLFVRKDFRKSGLAVDLLNHLLQRATHLNLNEVYLGTTSVLIGAQKFYEKMGFKSLPKEKLPQEFEICEVDTIFYKYQL